MKMDMKIGIDRSHLMSQIIELIMEYGYHFRKDGHEDLKGDGEESFIDFLCAPFEHSTANFCVRAIEQLITEKR